MEAQQRVDRPNLCRLFEIGEVAAVPSEEHVTLVERRKRKMRGVSTGVARHDVALDVDLHNVDDFRRNPQEFQSIEQTKPFGFAR